MTDKVEGPGLSSSCLNIYRLKNPVKTFYSRNLHLLEKSPLGSRLHHLRLSCISFITFFLLACYPTFQSSVSFFLLQAVLISLYVFQLVHLILLAFSNEQLLKPPVV